ncbi:hypothetical protein ACFL38_02895 [Candidatus Omnitrophota bacterium]
MTIKGNPKRIFCDGVYWGELDKASFDEMVGYLKKRVEICFFNPIKTLLLPEYKTTGFMMIAVLSSLIDLVSQYYYGQPGMKSKDKYKRFLRDHFVEFRQKITVKKFSHVKDLADFFYEGFRCQILHNFMLTEYSTIGWQTGLVHINTWNTKKDLKEIIINPRLLTERLESVFLDYIDDLLNPKNAQLREAFVKKLFIDTGVKLEA